MKKFSISDQSVNNIKIFLSRASLTGEEVPAFNDIIIALSRPIIDKPKNVEEELQAISTEMLLLELDNRNKESRDSKKVEDDSDDDVFEEGNIVVKEEIPIEKEVVESKLDKKEETTKKMNRASVKNLLRKNNQSI